MSRILSVSCDDAFFHELDKHLRKVGVPRSVFIRAAVRAAMRGGDSVSEPVHTVIEEHRKYHGGKCNPMVMPRCPICWRDEE